MALDAAMVILTTTTNHNYNHYFDYWEVSRHTLGGCLMLRSLAMDWTPVNAARGQLPIVAISGEEDEVYPLAFVKSCLERFSMTCEVQHVVIPGLSHMPECEAEERTAAAFMLQMLGFGEFDVYIYAKRAPFPHEQVMEGVVGAGMAQRS